jgi:hypothetical protein
MLGAWQLIAGERRRQIDAEGWTAEHDDEHGDGQMLRAAVIYLHWGTDRQLPVVDEETDPRDGMPEGWPWDAKWWKPKDRKRNLVRAGALCLAERERLLRISPTHHTAHVDHKLNLVLDALMMHALQQAKA